MCGVFGLIEKNTDNIGYRIYHALNMLQHRGQDAAGIITYDGMFHLKKGLGLVDNVFNQKNLLRLKGYIGIGHTRYPTIGGRTGEDAQPFFVNHPFGIGLAHNGNITNYAGLKEHLWKEHYRLLNSTCDAEAILNVLAEEIFITSKDNGLNVENLFTAVRSTMEQLEGSYSTVAVIGDYGLLAFRDPKGIKPLVLGKSDRGYAVSSESCAFGILSYKILRDVKPGEVIFIDKNMKFYSEQIVPSDPHICIFEYVYFARPDSIIDGIEVYKARIKLGNELAKSVKRRNFKIDFVVPVPDTSRPAAQGLADKLALPLREGLMKYRYIGRTFIMADQKERVSSIRTKMNPIEGVIKGKDIILVDDSIVRGNTSKEIIYLVRNQAANSVYFASSSPPLRFPCVYGIDMATREDFIAGDKTEKEIEKEIGADGLVYQTMQGLIKAVDNKRNFCTACFSGKYPTSINKKILKLIEEERTFWRKKIDIEKEEEY